MDGSYPSFPATYIASAHSNCNLLTIESIVSHAEAISKSTLMPIDTDAYAKYGKDPFKPIISDGNPQAPMLFIGRDLGEQEIRAGVPLIGASGMKVRRAIARAKFPLPGKSKVEITDIAAVHALFTNIVPFKPSGNVAFTRPIRELFRPILMSFICNVWTGKFIITLGTEPFEWFLPYMSETDKEKFSSTINRFSNSISITMNCGANTRKLILLPLPHPSPLNRRWSKEFPDLIDQRLQEVGR